LYESLGIEEKWSKKEKEFAITRWVVFTLLSSQSISFLYREGSFILLGRLDTFNF